MCNVCRFQKIIENNNLILYAKEKQLHPLKHLKLTSVKHTALEVRVLDSNSEFAKNSFKMNKLEEATQCFKTSLFVL